MPTLDSGDDFVGVGGPDEGFWLPVVLGEVAIDGGLEVDEGAEDTAFEATLRQFGEEAFDGIEPRARGRGEVESEALMAIEPSSHLGMLVGSVVVEDDVDGLADRRFGLDGVEEADEFLVTMALHVPTNDGAVEHVEGGKQGGCAVALVVMGHGAEPSLLHRQAGLGTVERLDLALLVDRQHDGVGRRVDVEADDIAQLVNEQRVVGELELPPAVGLQAVRLPDATHCAGADADRGRHHIGGPVRGLAGRVGKRQGYDALSHFRAERRNARGSRLVTQQTFDAFRGEAFLPAPYARLGLAGLSHDVDGADAVSAQQDNLGTPDVLLTRVAILDERYQSLTIGRRNAEGNPCAHDPDSHAHSIKGIPNRTLMLDRIH